MIATGKFPVQQSLHLMIGAATNPSLFSAGAGFELSMLKVSAAISHDTDLGTTSSFGISLTL